MSWSNGLAHWTKDDTAYLSVVFSWRLPDAYQLAIWYREHGYRVHAGGPGMFARRDFLKGVAELGGDLVDALSHHNPRATIASRGCPVGCYFCIVPKMEGLTFTLLPDFTPRPILCDNNLSALPVEYQEHIIEKYHSTGTPLEDANSGFEPRTFDEGTFARWSEINRGPWRFAYDEMREREDVYRVTQILRDVPAYRKRVYVLIGNEPMDACLGRIAETIQWGCEPYAQPLIALNSLRRKPMVRFDWSEQKLQDVTRWVNRWLWRKFGFAEYAGSVSAQPAIAGEQMMMEYQP